MQHLRLRGHRAEHGEAPPAVRKEGTDVLEVVRRERRRAARRKGNGSATPAPRSRRTLGVEDAFLIAMGPGDALQAAQATAFGPAPSLRAAWTWWWASPSAAPGPLDPPAGSDGLGKRPADARSSRSALRRSYSGITEWILTRRKASCRASSPRFCPVAGRHAWRVRRQRSVQTLALSPLARSER